MLLKAFVTRFHDYYAQICFSKGKRELRTVCGLYENNNFVAISAQFQLLFCLLLKLNHKEQRRMCLFKVLAAKMLAIKV